MNWLVMDAEKRHHGLQLAAAVVLAYFVSMVVGLPEHFWAVMSTLIVMRPNSASTFDAGLDRARGTLIGVTGGLLGVYLQHMGSNAMATTLSVIVLLSFASAASPPLRSAPVAALIILAAGSLPGHSPLQVATLRVVQILIGVSVAMGVAIVSSRYRAGDRLRAGCAALLQRMARSLQDPDARNARDESDAEKAGIAVRSALDRLTTLAGSADRASRHFSLFKRAEATGGERHHRNIAGLTSRIVQDISVLNRLLRVAGERQPLCSGREAALAAGAGLASVADVLAGRGRPDLAALRAATHARGEDAPDALLTAPLCLLLEDLQRLVRVMDSRQNPA